MSALTTLKESITEQFTALGLFNDDLVTFKQFQLCYPPPERKSDEVKALYESFIEHRQNCRENVLDLLQEMYEDDFGDRDILQTVNGLDITAATNLMNEVAEKLEKDAQMDEKELTRIKRDATKTLSLLTSCAQTLSGELSEKIATIENEVDALLSKL